MTIQPGVTGVLERWREASWRQKENGNIELNWWIEWNGLLFELENQQDNKINLIHKVLFLGRELKSDFLFKYSLSFGVMAWIIFLKTSSQVPHKVLLNQTQIYRAVKICWYFSWQYAKPPSILVIKYSRVFIALCKNLQKYFHLPIHQVVFQLFSMKYFQGFVSKLFIWMEKEILFYQAENSFLYVKVFLHAGPKIIKHFIYWKAKDFHFYSHKHLTCYIKALNHLFITEIIGIWAFL